MDARERQKRIRIAYLVNEHPNYASAIGIKVGLQQKKGKEMRYYLGLATDNPKHNHELHDETCPKLPSANNREFLGIFSTSRDALREAKKKYPYWNNIDGCKLCCPEIHTE